MKLQVIRQGNLAGVVGGQKATMQIPTAHIHHGLVLRATKAGGVGMSAQEIADDIGAITIRLGGKVKYDAVPASFFLKREDFWNAKDGAFVTAGDIFISFTSNNFKSAVERSLLAWGMQDVPSYAIEVDITRTPPTAGAVLVNIEVFSLVEFGSRNLGRHLCIGRHAPTFGGTGTHELTTLPFGDPDVGILVDHITPGAGTITKVNLKNNQVDLWNDVPIGLNNLILRRSGRTAQTGIYHLDYALVNHKDGFMPSSFLNGPRYDINFSVQPDGYVIYREEVRGLTAPVV